MYAQTITVYIPKQNSGDRYRIFVEPENFLLAYDTPSDVWGYIEHFTVNAKHRTFTLQVVREA